MKRLVKFFFLPSDGLDKVLKMKVMCEVEFYLSSQTVYSLSGLILLYGFVGRLYPLDDQLFTFTALLLKSHSLYGTAKSFIDVRFIFLIN